MKKTFTANLNGTVFHIEEDAYDQLQRYLANIRAKFSGSAEAEEIMADIEARIAELFTERLQGRQAIGTADVDHVKQVMGQPEDYVDGEAADGPASTEDRSYHDYGPRKHKRLFRDPDDRWLAGVISGLAAYFGTDPLWFRIGFIAVVIFGWGTPIFIYLIMWALVPEAATAGEKLEMHGEEVTVDNIKRMFDEGTERFKAGAEKVAGEAREIGRRYWRQSKAQRYSVGYRVEGIAHRLLDVLGKVVGIGLLLLAIVLGLSLIAGLVSGAATWSIAGGTGLTGLLAFIFPNSMHAMGFSLSLFTLLLVPVILLLLSALWLLFRVQTPRWISWCLSVFFILSLVFITVICIKLAADFRSNGVDRTEMVIATPASGTLNVRLPEERNYTAEHSFRFHRGVINLDMNLVDFEGDSVMLGLAQLNVEQSPDSAYHLVMERVARGNTEANAKERAGNIRTQWVWSADDVLRLSDRCTIPLRDKMRAQHVNYLLQIPLGGRVHFAPGTEVLMHDRMNGELDRHSELDSDMAGQTWTMTSDGLKPEKELKKADPVSEQRAPAHRAATALAMAAAAANLSVPVPNLLELLTAGLRP